MDLDLNQTRMFVEVVRAGSFAAAARRLGIPKSTVSARIQALEARLGAQLLRRSTRQLALTLEGEAYFDAVAGAVDRLVDGAAHHEDLRHQLHGGADGGADDTRGDGPQAVLSRTLRLGQISSAGVARVLDVVRGSSGGIVVTEWVPGSSLADVARSGPSPIGAARAVRALAAAAEAAHRSGGALSIDHPDRIRISTDGNAVLAFPGTLAGDDKSSDVRGLGAVLYALLLARWPLDGETGHDARLKALPVKGFQLQRRRESTGSGGPRRPGHL